MFLISFLKIVKVLEKLLLPEYENFLRKTLEQKIR